MPHYYSLTYISCFQFVFTYCRRLQNKSDYTEITALSHSFELLQEAVLKELDLTKSNVSQLREAVAGVYPGKAIPKSVMTEMQAATGSHNLFAVITRHGMWNYINHRLLEYMVEKTVPQNNHLQNEIEVHKRKVEKNSNS